MAAIAQRDTAIQEMQQRFRSEAKTAEEIVNHLVAERDRFIAQQKSSQDNVVELELKLSLVEQQASNEEAAYEAGKQQPALDEKRTL